ncbi:MAG TPA: ribonuclease HII [Actinobacteria bacterium]|nr:ribonuclease HII [Actinomycetota bacterium]
MGYELIAGMDEVGRGSLAGPIVAAAVILDRKSFMIEGINDSKKLTPIKRNQLYKKIIASCACWSIAKIGPAEIDRQNITMANIKVFDLAARSLKIKPDIIISDFINIDSKKLASASSTGFIPISKGDQSSVSIAAASIVAKVTRDRIMEKMALTFPEYGFDKNKGYGTKKHMLSIQKYGPTRIHRMTFRGVLEY